MKLYVLCHTVERAEQRMVKWLSENKRDVLIQSMRERWVVKRNGDEMMWKVHPQVEKH